MTSLEEQIEQAVNRRVEAALSDLTNFLLRIRLREQARDIARTADFTDAIRERFASIHRENWFVDALRQPVQNALDSSLLSYIHEHADAALQTGEIEGNVNERTGQYAESEEFANVIDQFIVQVFHQRMQSEHVIAAIDDLVRHAVSQRLRMLSQEFLK